MEKQGILLKTLTFSNFLSFGKTPTVVDLTQPGTIHVLGENLDTGGASGAGKTTILNAISFALYDKAISNITKERLINRTNNKKDTQMEVKLEFEKDGIEYVVHRMRGESYNAKLIIDGEDKTPDSIINLNRRLEEILGISYDLFNRVVIFLGSDKGFLELPVSQQRQQIEELFKITVLSDKATILKGKIKETEKAISIKEAEIKAAGTAKQLREKHIVEAEQRLSAWETQRDAKIAALKSQLDSIAGIDFDRELQIADELRAVTQEYNTKTNTRKDLSFELTKKQKDHKQKVTELEHLRDGKCPYCSQAYDNAEKMEELAVKINELVGEITELQSEINAIDFIQSELKIAIDALKAEQTVPDVEKLNQTRLNLTTIKVQMDQHRNDVNPYIEPLEKLLSEDEVIVDTVGLDSFTTELSHQQFLLKLLTDKSSFVRKTILNKNIPLLNRQLQHYTKELGLPHIIRFTPDMECEITEYGRELDFGNLSGGEKSRVNIALSLSFRDMMRYLHCPVNVLFADEIDAGTLDSATMDAVIRLLKSKARNEEIGIWCISHRVELMGRLDREIMIRKERGFSSVVF